MERRSGRIEDLPPLELRSLRELDLAQPPHEGQAAHIASASGVIRRGDFVYVIGDDLLSIGVFKLTSQEPGKLAAALPDEHSDDENKGTKPDLEALTALPPFTGHPYGALFGLGSGSEAGRDRGFVWALTARGALDGDPRTVDLGPLYELLGRELEVLNLEGAAVVGDRLWLLNRGNKPGATNAVAELSLADVMDSLQGDLRIDPHELAALRSYELGDLEGVELNFSDATPLANEVLVFTASAEEHGGSGPDGQIRGSVVGTIDPQGEVRRLRTIDRRYKVEGVHASIDAGVIDLLFVCDQDDPSSPSPLLSATMPLEAGLEG